MNPLRRHQMSHLISLTVANRPSVTTNDLERVKMNNMIDDDWPHFSGTG